MKVPSESFTKGPDSGWDVLIPGVDGFLAGSWVAGSLAWISAWKQESEAGISTREHQREFRSFCMGWIDEGTRDWKSIDNRTLRLTGNGEIA